MAEEQPSAAKNDIRTKTDPEDVDPCNKNEFAIGQHLAPSDMKCAGTSPITNQSGMNEDNGDEVVESPTTNQSGMNEDIGDEVMGSPTTNQSRMNEDIGDEVVGSPTTNQSGMNEDIADAVVGSPTRNQSGMNEDIDDAVLESPITNQSGMNEDIADEVVGNPTTNQSGMNEDIGDEVVGSPTRNQSGMNEDIGEVMMNLKDDVSTDDPEITTLQEKQEDICDHTSRIKQKDLRIRPVRVVLVDLIYKQQAKKGLNTNLPMAKDCVSADDPERTTLQEKEEDICDSRIEQKDLRIRPVRIVLVDHYKQLAKKGLNANKDGGHTGRSSNRLRSRPQIRTNYTEISSDQDEEEGEDKGVDSSFDELDPGRDSVDQNEDKPWRCGCCEKMFRLRMSRNKHEMTHQRLQDREYKCSQCDQTFKGQQTYFEHTCCNSDTKKHSSSRCSAEMGKMKEGSFSTLTDSNREDQDQASTLQVEQRSKKFYEGLIRLQALGKITEFPAETLNKMVKQGTSKYSMVCTICNKEWKIISAMATHVQAHARGRNFSCLKCGRDFRVKQWYDLHCELHLQGLWQENDKPGSRQHTCQLCHRIFPSQAPLFLHRKKHQKEEEPWRCGCCQKTFKRPGHRQHHEMDHLKSKCQVFECSECNESFKSQHTLWNHRVTHMLFNPDTKIYSCDKCSAKYRNPNSMASHRLTHSFEAVCKRCGKHIGKRHNLAAHEKHCNGAEKRAKRFQCEYCGKVFMANCFLKRHRTIHTGEENPRRFQCDQCGKCFEHKMNLQRHVLIHTGDRPFECKHCGMKFNQDTARDRHVKLHFKHGEYRDVIKHHVTVKKGRDGRQYAL